MNIDRLKLGSALSEDMERTAVRRGFWACCTNCAHWGPNALPSALQPGCMKFKAMPPWETIVIGCKEWEFGVPF